MKWLEYSIAGLFLFLALPVWRLTDWAALTLPFPYFTLITYGLWVIIFIAFPLKLIIKKMKIWMVLLGILVFMNAYWLTGPLTNLATLEPNNSHCGQLTYTGFFYPLRRVLSNVHKDDLEVRNQLCWIVKMIQRVPEKIKPEDLPAELNQVGFKLMKPNHKYRVTLPWLAFLFGRYFSANESAHGPLDKIQNGKYFFDTLKYWTQIYNEEISFRNYAWYEWPYSSLIKMEYGLIERNWEKIHVEFK